MAQSLTTSATKLSMPTVGSTTIPFPSRGNRVNAKMTLGVSLVVLFRFHISITARIGASSFSLMKDCVWRNRPQPASTSFQTSPYVSPPRVPCSRRSMPSPCPRPMLQIWGMDWANLLAVGQTQVTRIALASVSIRVSVSEPTFSFDSVTPHLLLIPVGPQQPVSVLRQPSRQRIYHAHIRSVQQPR